MSQTIFPSAVEYARKCPSSPPENTSPGIAVTAADCAGLHPGTSPQPGCGVRQTSSPVSSLRAQSPPPALLSMSKVTLELGPRLCAPGVVGATGWNLGSDTAT